MRYGLFVFFLLVSSLLLPSFADARDCPGRLSGHLYEVNDKLSIGAELRGFYVGASVGENMPTTALKKDFEHNTFWGLKPRLEWFINDNLSFVGEVAFRFAYPGWESETIPHFRFRPNAAYFDFEKKGFRITAGIQTFTFGTAAVLDQRFAALLVGYKKRKFGVQIFGGTTHRAMMKNAVNCMWMSYISHTNGWKTAADSMTNAVAGLILTYKPWRRYRFQFLYLLSMPNVNNLRSHAFSLYATGPIIKRYLSFRVEAIGFLNYVNRFMGAVVARLKGRLGKSRKAPRASIGIAASFNGNKETARLGSIYENLSWGLMQRFNLYQGNIGFVRASWQGLNLRKAKLKAKLFARYHAQTFAFTSDDFSDELDVGVKLSFRKLYDLTLAYAGVNLAPSIKSTHFAYVELRVIFGQ